MTQRIPKVGEVTKTLIIPVAYQLIGLVFLLLDNEWNGNGMDCKWNALVIIKVLSFVHLETNVLITNYQDLLRRKGRSEKEDPRL